LIAYKKRINQIAQHDSINYIQVSIIHRSQCSSSISVNLYIV
jgi:hypothetical protein